MTALSPQLADRGVHHADHMGGRRYTVAELADKGDFMDATFLLLHGELPDKKQKQKFAKVICSGQHLLAAKQCLGLLALFTITVHIHIMVPAWFTTDRSQV